MQNTDLNSFKTDFDGQVILPGDEEYAAASTTLFGKGAPAIIVRPRTVQAVAQAVGLARQKALEISLRSGGHSGAGFGTNNGGMVIDVSRINDIELIDKERRIVRLGSGAHWGDVAQELSKHGLSVSSGDTKSVGVAGLTLGGGVGWMVRKYGLAIDCLVAAELVTADGQLIRATAEEHPDLFWAIRGAGGNFGVLTHLEFEAHDTGKVLSGSITYAMDDLAGTLKSWRDAMRQAPAELTTTFMILPEMMGNPASASVAFCYAGTDRDALEPLLRIGKVTHQEVAEKDYHAILVDGHAPEGVKVLIHNVLLPELNDEITDTIARQAQDHQMLLQVRSVGGALNKVPAEATAFAHRRSEVLVISPLFMPQTATEEEIDAALAPWQKIAAYGEGACINFFAQVNEEIIKTVYPPAALQRLAAIKKTYDPQNIFHHNFNILPAAD